MQIIIIIIIIINISSVILLCNLAFSMTAMIVFFLRRIPQQYTSAALTPAVHLGD
jgi:hypothetical protein